MTDKQDEGLIYEKKNFDGSISYVDREGNSYETVDGICINASYFASSGREVKVVHVNTETGYVFFRAVIGYHVGGYWMCAIEPFKRQFFTRPVSKKTSSVGGVVSVVVDKDWNVVKRNLSLKLETKTYTKVVDVQKTTQNNNTKTKNNDCAHTSGKKLHKGISKKLVNRKARARYNKRQVANKK